MATLTEVTIALPAGAGRGRRADDPALRLVGRRALGRQSTRRCAPLLPAHPRSGRGDRRADDPLRDVDAHLLERWRRAGIGRHQRRLAHAARRGLAPDRLTAASRATSIPARCSGRRGRRRARHACPRAGRRPARAHLQPRPRRAPRDVERPSPPSRGARPRGHRPS